MLELRTRRGPLDLGIWLLPRNRLDPSDVDCVVDETELVVSRLVLEVVAVLLTELGNEFDNLGSRPRDFYGISFDVHDLNAFFLQRMLEVDHEKSPTLRDDVVAVTQISEGVIELG